MAANGDVAITGAANKVTRTFAAATAASTQTISFSGEKIGFGGTAKNISFATGAAATAADNAATAVNADVALREQGVFAVRTTGNDVAFVSLKEFNMSVSAAASGDAADNSVTAQAPTAVTGGVATGGESGAKSAIDAIKAAVATLGQIQGKVGAGQNNLSQAIDLASAQITNFQAAESSIRDADIAQEASNLARLNTLQQAGVSALAQANQSSQALLSLLR